MNSVLTTNSGEIVSKLRDWRINEGISQRTAGARIGVSQQAWADYESEPGSKRHKMPSHDVMVAICHLTGLQPNDFYDLEAGEPAGAAA